MNREVPINNAIRARNVRVVDGSGNQLGVFSLREALQMATNQGQDLIQISNGEVPVCRFGDAGKFLFERKKNLKENARRQREMAVEVKEIQLRPVTDTNDLTVKARKANDFLANGDKVKIVIRFKGRERAHKEQGHLVLDQFLGQIIEYKVDRPVADTGRDISTVLAPTKSKADLRKERRN